MVRRLSSQVEGLQDAMRQRSVIEQAKGVLVAREGWSVEEAFGALVRASQHRNVKVARVAAEVVATAGAVPAVSGPAAPAAPCSPSRSAVPVPSACSAAGPASPEEERAWRGAYPLALAAVEAAGSPDELAEALRRFPADRPPDHVLVTVLEADGSLALVGSAGLEPRAASVWRRIPAVVDLPVTVAARFGAPVWCPDAEDMRARFPGVAHLVPLRADGGGDVVGAERRIAGVDQTAAPPAVAALPLMVGGAVQGVLALGWVGEQPFPEVLRSHLTVLADAVARRLEQLQAHALRADAVGGDPGPTGPALAAVTIALQTVLDPALLLSPVRGGDG
ncbi:MAG TPA: ANTAR domain-containing protein, partial [Motilibacteraceae bacterium]|nr:ANTAR domain-containing protein [Motilibacteraceae bacterium]